jgi:hypothetical protein
MKTRNLLAIVAAVLVTAPLLNVVACNGDSSQADSGPQNGDSGKDVTPPPPDTGPGPDATPDSGPPCLTFDNTLVPGYPNNIPQP